MSTKSHENLKAIRFAGELLPNWAQLFDLAAKLCPVSEEVRHWFCQLTTRAGVDDTRLVISHVAQAMLAKLGARIKSRSEAVRLVRA